jgi:hypothetical protein
MCKSLYSRTVMSSCSDSSNSLARRPKGLVPPNVGSALAWRDVAGRGEVWHGVAWHGEAPFAIRGEGTPLFFGGYYTIYYLASPYTHVDVVVRQRRYEAACLAISELLKAGQHVYSPIVYSHQLCAYGLPVDWQFWQEYDRRLLEICDGLIVLQLDGWQESVGVNAEMAIARELGKPISFLSPAAVR